MENKRKLFLLPAAILLLALLVGCSSQDRQGNFTDAPSAPETTEISPPKKLSPAEAKEIMDSDEVFLLLDVRTQEEFDAQHIEGAVCIPDTELSARKGELPADSDALILVYCRSGRRSAASASLLAEMGYSRVFDFGGIIDWPYETIVSEAESPAPAEGSGTHTHEWKDYDCNYQQCTVCGAQKRYSDPD